MKLLEKTCRELTAKGCIQIPPVQRGLVWQPSQVGILWDSITQGMPIGALLAYQQKNDFDTLQLLDGQQRCNAIKCGLAPDENDSFRVWVGLDDNKLFFMVCSESHPWGYKKDYSIFSYEERDEYNALLRGEYTTEKNLDKEITDDIFAVASLQQAYPMVKVASETIFVPLNCVLEAGDAGYEKWEKSPLFRKPSEIISLLAKYTSNHGLKMVKTEKDIRNAISAISAMLRERNVQNYRVPVHVIEHGEQLDDNYIETLFSRLNTQGTSLSKEDALYSSLCVLLGADIKDAIHEQSDNFMPPARLARWAVRLYMLLKDDKERDILTDATEADFRHVVCKEESDNFVKFCREELPIFRKRVKMIYSNKVGVPPLIYLEHRDDNWITVIAGLDDTAFDTNSTEWKKWYPLLGMLPDVVCSRMSCAHLFIKTFWQGYKELKKNNSRPLSLKTILAVGCAYAALRENCFVHKYPSSMNSLDTGDGKDVLDSAWNWNSLSQSQIRALIPFTHNKFILYYAQRHYLGLILNSMNPAMREIWGKESNRPFDIDHIIPRDYWPNEIMMDQLANKQILFFRHNRMKGAHYCGLPENPEYLRQKSREWFIYPEEVSYAECKKEDTKTTPSLYKENTLKRWIFLIKTVYEDLHIDELIQHINQLCDSESINEIKLPSPIPEAIGRYSFMKNVERGLEKEMGKLQWGSVTYRGLARNNVIGMMKIDEIQDFYHSLEPWLSLGKESEKNGVPIFPCITIGLDKNIEIGKRRGFGISSYVDHEMYKRWMQIERPAHLQNNDWWITQENEKMESADVCEIAEKIKNLYKF